MGLQLTFLIELGIGSWGKELFHVKPSFSYF